jgi:hypothetical protein
VRLLALSIFAAAAAIAADVESLHVFNFNFVLGPSLTVQLHSRARTFEHVKAFQQLRLGPILYWRRTDRLTLVAGYYNIDQGTRQTHNFFGVHRYWSGAQVRVARDLHYRGLVERFVSDNFQDYFRVRNRLMWIRGVRVGQFYGSAEALMQQGIWYGRYTTGVTWTLHDRLSLSTGYEYRDAARGPGSHIIATTLNWDALRAKR